MIQKFSFLVSIVVTQLYPYDNMTQNYTYILYQGQFPDLGNIL